MTNTKQIYLDYAATAPLSESMKKYLISVLDLWGNPSSLHSVGEPARLLIENTRRNTAEFINADTNNIYFTCGGAASNTLAVRGYDKKHNCTVFYSPTSHKSILTCAGNCKNAHSLHVDDKGFIDLNDLKKRLDRGCINPFIVIDHANSEIGTIQNINAITDLVHFYHGVVYLDCTGSIPAVPMDIQKTKADMIGFSAHKLGGLKGCGVLYKKDAIRLEPLVYGSQERGLIGGTENIPGIASLGKAIEDYDYSAVSAANRDYLYERIINSITKSYLVGASTESKNRLPHNLYMCFKGIEGEALMILLDLNGIQVSTGSACTSGDLTASATLSAIGMEEQDVHSCIRMTFSGKETKEELDYVAENLKKCVDALRDMN